MFVHLGILYKRDRQKSQHDQTEPAAHDDGLRFAEGAQHTSLGLLGVVAEQLLKVWMDFAQVRHKVRLALPRLLAANVAPALPDGFR